MQIYKSPMEKILKQMEDDTVITNPKNRTASLLRKIAFLWARWTDRRRNGASPS